MSTDFYNRVAPAYAEHGRFYTGLATSLLAQVTLDPEPRRILDVGAGTGFSTAALRDRWPAAELIALEPAEAMRALGEAAVPSAEWRSDSLADTLAETFDLIFVSASSHWLFPREWRQLLAASHSSTLALSAPASEYAPGRLGDLPSGNRLLVRLMLHMRPSPPWDCETRSRIAWLRADPDMVTSASNIHVDETFADLDELAAALHTRGSLTALFGDRADEARASLVQMGAPEPVDFRWGFDLVVVSGARTTDQRAILGEA